ncbi:hypothetical protein KUTeg_009255 [Tegillarca granosa]|uniref:Uncharacterized protein n=1 Tax=Tegillarca granosa TaxID=220873 RepID=A0ABQ9F757_TEGGR|nr:hypothetical protein KUTeg_009255 [Tegillarca granosa]
MVRLAYVHFVVFDSYLNLKHAVLVHVMSFIKRDSDPFELNQPIVAVGATQSNPNSSNDKCGDTSSESECDDSSSDSEYVVSSSDSEYDDTSSDSEYVVSSSDSEYDDTSSDSEYVVSSLENEDDVSSSENEDDVSSSENKDEMEEVLTRREDQCDDACDDIQDCLNDISTKTIDDDSSFEKDLIQREDGRDDGDEYCPTELSTESSRDGDNSSKKAGYDEQSQMFKTPSLALKIGQSLEKCARYKRSDAIKENNKCKQKEAEDFLCLYKSDWKDDVSSVASNSLNDQKYNKAQLLPLTDDVVKLNKHLQSTANSLCKKIGNNPDLYSKLAQVLLTQVILFNRRRSGEAERMLLEGFNDAIKNGSGRPDPVVMSTLTEFEKHLCTSHTRVEIRGKRGRKVPVLLTDKMRQQIEVLVYNRNKANVKQPYLFARPGEFTKPYREILESESESETDDLTVIEKDVADGHLYSKY